MIYSILFVILAALSYWYWRFTFIPQEVRENAADFEANGSADDLQQGYHGRETWSRVWPALTCCVVPSLSFSLSNLTSCLLSFLAMVALIGGSFARWFTPLLNLARVAAGQWWITEWTASAASKSFPDATAWVRVRRRLLPETDNQPAANAEMKSIILRTWLQCRIAAALLATAAAWVAIAQ